MKRAIQTLVGLAFGGFLVWLLVRGTDWREVGQSIRNVHVGWFIAAQLALWATFPMRVQRWTYIVRAAGPASFRHLFSATQIGFLANFTLPARLGEIVRAVVLSRLTGLKFAQSVAMVGLDRVTDLFGLMAVLTVSLVAFRPSGDVTIPAETFGMAHPFTFPAGQYRAGAVLAGLFLVAVVAVNVMLYVNRTLVIALNNRVLGLVSRTVAAKTAGLLDHFADGLQVFRSPRDMVKSISWSLTVWGCAVLVNFAMLEAFGIAYPWYTPFVMVTLLAIFISAPGAPGLVGQYHMPIVITLAMLAPGINLDHAKAFAIVAHAMNLPPIIVTAAYAMYVERLGVGDLGRLTSTVASNPPESGR